MVFGGEGLPWENWSANSEFILTKFHHLFLKAPMLFFVLLKVADFLAKRRDNMFLEFDISISHSVRDTFLSTGNEAAYKVSGKEA